MDAATGQPSFPEPLSSGAGIAATAGANGDHQNGSSNHCHRARTADDRRRRVDEVRNVLFVLHGDFRSNSATHVHALANALTDSGLECLVVIEGDPATREALSPGRYRALTYAAALGERGSPGARFTDGRPADVVHAWTPRERVRRFCAALRARPAWAGGAEGARVVVHLEDNEEAILEASFQKSMRQLRAMDRATLDAVVPTHLCDPHRYREFLAGADGVTLLIDRLGEFVPEPVPRQVFWPAADPELFFPRPPDPEERARLGIRPGEAVFVYTGNVHQSNAREVRSLYLAVALLNRQGCPTRLVRTGEDWARFLGEDDAWTREFVVQLGRQPRERLPGLLALADILVQPGRPDAFNDYRFPSKVPEFFAMGRPLILPATNVGLRVEHGRHAWVLPRVDATGIAEATRHILGDPNLAVRLAAGAMEFSENFLDWRQSAGKLRAFYESLTPSCASSPV